MSRNEVDLAVQWATDEGWNPGLHDADCYLTADPYGFLVGLLDDEPIASISVIKYDDSFGFLGFYIVKPAYRGQGYGWQLWQAGLAYLKGCNVALDGVVAQQENYKKSGFKLAYRNIRHAGIGGGLMPDDDRLIPLAEVPFEQLERYERPFFPAHRPHFLRAWIQAPGTTALGIVEENQLRGYGVIRPCRDGYKIGPLHADSSANADILFRALSSRTESGAPIFLDTPEVNPAAVALARAHAMEPSFETARMYTGTFPNLPTDRIFGVTSFEIG